MTVSFRCPACQTMLETDPATMGSPVVCRECGVDVLFSPSVSIRERNVVDACPCCGKQAFYVQRDFSQKVGLLVMAAFALAALGFAYVQRPLLFYACLAAGALADLLLYRLLPQITICYACKATFRDVSRNPDHGPFDLHIADVYDQRSKG